MTARFPSIKYIYDRYKKASSTKKAMVEMRITYNRRQKYISTNISLYPKQWKNGMVVNCHDAMRVNALLDQMMGEVKEIIYSMIKEGEIDIFQIPDRLQLKRDDKISFFAFCEQRAAIRKYGKEKDTQEVGYLYEPGEANLLFSRRKENIYIELPHMDDGFFLSYAFFVEKILEGYHRPISGK